MNLMVKYILALVTLFNIIFTSICTSEIINKVIAYVDDEAITLKDFIKFKDKITKTLPEITNEEIVEILINRKLLSKKGKELFFEGDEEAIINNYIEFKVKSKIIITDSQIRDYYEKNKKIIGQESFTSLREQIEKYLFEKELNEKLKKLIQELKNEYDIKVNFIP